MKNLPNVYSRVKKFRLFIMLNFFSKFGNTTKKPKTVEHHGGAMVMHRDVVIAINHSILGIFQNFKTEWKLDFVSYI
jgi:hypothetical protein